MCVSPVHSSLQSQLDRQELSPAEVRQMTHDRDMLQHGLQQLDQRKTEVLLKPL